MSQSLYDWQYWILLNLQALGKRFGRSNVALNGKTWGSIAIYRFPLPSNWYQSYSRLLLVLPKGPQIFYRAPDKFYLDMGLRARNGKVPGHYFEHAGFNDMQKYNIARFSFHVNKGWNPSRGFKKGTNVLHVIDGLQIGLRKAADEVLR